MLGGIGVQHRRDVVLGVHRGEQHAGDGEDVVTARISQIVQPVPHDGVGEFEVTIVHVPLGEMGFQALGNLGELVDSGLATGAVPADHYTIFSHDFSA